MQAVGTAAVGRLSVYCRDNYCRKTFMSDAATKKKIELEIEVGTTTVERGINPYQ